MDASGSSGRRRMAVVQGALARRAGRRQALAMGAGLLAGAVCARMAVAASQAPDEVAFLALLDGNVYGVDYGPSGEPSLGKDVLTFLDGTFASRGCARYGFAAAPYWLRLADGRIHFKCEMTSPEMGIFAFVGQVAGPDITATSLWTRKRWYRTVRLESWYRGSLAQPGRPLPEKS